MPHIPRAVCGRCNHEMTPMKSGEVLEGLVLRRGRLGDLEEDPYYKIQSDRWQCGKCLLEVFVGFGSSPIVEHFHEDYDAIVAVRRFTFR